MTGNPQIRVIEAGRTERHYWRDLWYYRELLLFLAWRDVKVRYKQTAIGLSWVLLRPFLTMLVLTVVFHRIAGLGQGSEIPYPLMVLAGLLPWQFFAAALSDSGNSLVGNAQMISKVYFPRMLIPLASVLAGLVDFAVSLLLLVLMMIWYGTWPGMQVLLLPLFMVLGMAISLGAGISLAALNVEYRDVRYVIPFLVQFGLYLSPVGFSSDTLPSQWRWLYDLNPLVGVIDGFRWCLLGSSQPLSATAVTSSVLVACSLLMLGIGHFRRVERRFSDII